MCFMCMAPKKMTPRDPSVERACRKCGVVKPGTDFYKDKQCDANGGLTYACKECTKEKVSSWYWTNHERARVVSKTYRSRTKEAVRDKLLQRKYGIDQAEYDALLESQGGGCAICGATEDPIKDGRAMPVDHCHTRDVVRGVLCSSCNRAIGLLNDDPDRLDKAAHYLRTHFP